MPQIVSVRARVHVFHHKVSDLTIANVNFYFNMYRKMLKSCTCIPSQSIWFDYWKCDLLL